MGMVGGIPTPLKDMKVNWDDEIPNIWENKSHVPVTTNQLKILNLPSWIGQRFRIRDPDGFNDSSILRPRDFSGYQFHGEQLFW